MRVVSQADKAEQAEARRVAVAGYRQQAKEAAKRLSDLGAQRPPADA